MSDYEDDQFEQSGSGASLTYPKQCSALRKNEFVMIKGKACKIVDMSTSKTGKHGHAKVHLVALDIFGEYNFYMEIALIRTHRRIENAILLSLELSFQYVSFIRTG